MQIDKQEKLGIFYALSSNILWAFFPVLTLVTYKAFPSLLALTATTTIAAIFFFIVILVQGKLHELKNLEVLKYGVFIALTIAVGF